MNTLKRLFPEYYDPSYHDLSPHQRAAFWRWCTLAMDASALLSLYAYSSPAREEFLDTLESLADRIWIPHQAAFEYEKNRVPKIEAQIRASEKIREALRSGRGKMQEDAQKQVPRVAGEAQHPFVNLSSIHRRLDKVVDEVHGELEAAETEYKRLLKEDPVRERLNEITSGRIGARYSREELENIYEEGRERYEREQPPGYMDAKGKKAKTGEEKYGDLVLWRQLVTRGATTGRSVLLVTNDMTEDWWRDTEHRGAGPRIELVDEMKRQASVRFLIADSPGFFEWAQRHLKRQASAAVTEEVRRAARLPLAQYAGMLSADLARALEQMTSIREFQVRFASLVDSIRGVSMSQSSSLQACLNEASRLAWENLASPLQWHYPWLASTDSCGDSSADPGDRQDDTADEGDAHGNEAVAGNDA